MRQSLYTVLFLSLIAADAVAQDRFMAPLPPDAQLRVTRDAEYGKSGDRALKFDLHRPAGASAPLPVVIMLNGIGADWMRAHTQDSGWGRYVTTRGFAGITMDSAEASVPADFDKLVAHLRTNAASLGVDPSRIVVWACSANVRAGLPLVSDPARTYVAGAVMYYGTSEVGRFRPDLPVLMVRAGVDNPGLNKGIDAIVAKATAANAPVSLINYPSGRHGFDVRDDTDLTRAVMAQTLDFMAAAVDPKVIAARQAGVAVAEAAATLTREDWDAAIAAYQALTKATPGDAEYAQRLGEAYAGKGEFGKAIPAFERALALGTPNRGIVTFALVRTNTKLNQLDKAFEWVQKLQPFFRFFRQRLIDDPDFAPLRADPRFEREVRSFKTGGQEL